MGRQAAARCVWSDRAEEVTALLESTEIILRGPIRARIPRAAISHIGADGGILAVTTSGGTLTLELGAQAEAWASILRKPPPSLREKLGVAAACKAFVIGDITDDTLARALDGATTPSAADAHFLVAEIHTSAGLGRAHAAADANAPLPIWIIGEKGRGAAVKDSEIRATLRAGRYVDTKSTAVSDAMTGTLYRPVRT